MAIEQNYNLEIPYSLGLINPIETYSNILTDEQLSDVINTPTKGFIINRAYYKIDLLNGSKDLMSIQIGVYTDNSCERLIATENYTFVPSLGENSSNFIKQGYEYLKTLPEFENAIDV